MAFRREVLTRQEFCEELVLYGCSAKRAAFETFKTLCEIEYNRAVNRGFGEYKYMNVLFKFDRLMEKYLAQIRGICSLLYQADVIEMEEYDKILFESREKGVFALADAFPEIAVDIYEYYDIVEEKKCLSESEVKDGKGNDECACCTG